MLNGLFSTCRTSRPAGRSACAVVSSTHRAPRRSRRVRHERDRHRRGLDGLRQVSEGRTRTYRRARTTSKKRAASPKCLRRTHDEVSSAYVHVRVRQSRRTIANPKGTYFPSKRGARSSVSTTRNVVGRARLDISTCTTRRPRRAPKTNLPPSYFAIAPTRSFYHSMSAAVRSILMDTQCKTPLRSSVR